MIGREKATNLKPNAIMKNYETANELSLGEILQHYYFVFKLLNELTNLATLIRNLQSEFTHHVTLFFKTELKFYLKTYLISQICTHFCSSAQ